MDKQAGFHPLQAAVLKNKYDIVLKAYGLPRYKSIKGLYNECAKDNSGQTKLQWAKCNDDAEQAVELILNDGAAINARASGNDYTVLMQASRSSSSQFIETLIDLGADVNAKTSVIYFYLGFSCCPYYQGCPLSREVHKRVLMGVPNSQLTTNFG